ncbi:hypothetical protein ACJMK2_042918 [Sinanodonta woodiana]|uniref:Integrase core domain-containing protein n=1 Tax=Sinanodonta woodiana TaxID=1069815 RepID=A0ABD3VVA4_SINWO
MDKDRLALIKVYFDLGLKHKEIVCILEERHGYNISIRQLIRILHVHSFYRYKNPTDVMTVAEFIMHEQRFSGTMHGYRWMYYKLKCRGIRARKEEVRLLMRVLDPNNVDLRQSHRLHRRMYLSKGPNYIWHMDSYDKLHPYGICINGCIDGFSRKMIWLNAYCTSSNPRVIGGYYLEAVKDFGGCPLIVRADRGTENGYVCEFQRLFRRHGTDSFCGDRSFMYGRSTNNQRIESWWGFLRKECVEFWLSLFDQIKAEGNFDGGYLDKNLVLFCFLGMIQDELDLVAEVWDSHVIRPSKNLMVPSGIPNVMFSVPELYDSENYMCLIDEEEFQLCQTNALYRDGMASDEDVYNLCIYIMAEQSLHMAKDAYEALDLYLELRQHINDIL